GSRRAGGTPAPGHAAGRRSHRAGPSAPLRSRAPARDGRRSRGSVPLLRTSCPASHEPPAAALPSLPRRTPHPRRLTPRSSFRDHGGQFRKYVLPAVARMPQPRRDDSFQRRPPMRLVKTVRIVSWAWYAGRVATASRAPLASRRSDRSRLAIVDAALALCREHGYARVSIEAIAARAGVGKQTIYRWWPSKGAVVLEAFERVAAEIPVPDTGDVASDMRPFLTDVVRLCADNTYGPHLGARIGEPQHDPSVGAALLARYP